MLVEPWSPPIAASGNRGSVLLLATIVPALALCILVAAERLWRDRKRRALLTSDPSGLLEPIGSWPGVRIACATVGLALIFLVCHQLIVPTDTQPGGYRVAAVARSAAAAMCAGAILVQVGRQWSANLADIALGLLTLAVCTLATVFVPEQPRELAPRYPLVFNALVFALALMTWFWSWLAEVWQQQLDTRAADGREPAWTTAGRLVSVNRRFALVTAVAGVVVAALMSVWPALRTVSADDDSLGRMSAGVVGHLLLLLAVRRCARWTQRAAFNILSLLVLLSMLAFVAVRARQYVG